MRDRRGIRTTIAAAVLVLAAVLTPGAGAADADRREALSRAAERIYSEEGFPAFCGETFITVVVTGFAHSNTGEWSELKPPTAQAIRKSDIEAVQLPFEPGARLVVRDSAWMIDTVTRASSILECLN